MEINHKNKSERVVRHMLFNCDAIQQDKKKKIKQWLPEEQSDQSNPAWTSTDQTEFEELFALFIYLFI